MKIAQRFELLIGSADKLSETIKPEVIEIKFDTVAANIRLCYVAMDNDGHINLVGQN